jgi:hypothetical protein
MSGRIKGDDPFGFSLHNCGGGGGLHSFVRLVDERFCAVLFLCVPLHGVISPVLLEIPSASP